MAKAIVDVESNIVGYGDLLDLLKEKIRCAQIKAAVAVNSELMCLYWEIGKEIFQK